MTMSITTHYLLTADSEALYSFYPHPTHNTCTISVFVSGEAEEVITHDMADARRTWSSIKAGGGTIVSSV
jgi:hypothetical protein